MVLGYFAVHLLGLSTGTMILPSSPSYFRRFQRQFNKTGELSFGGGEKYKDSYHARQNDKTATELWAYSMLWWALLGLTRLLQIDGKEGVSRRVVCLHLAFFLNESQRRVSGQLVVYPLGSGI